MVTKRETRTIRVTEHTFDILRDVAYKDPFRCSSLADFFGIIEGGGRRAMQAIAAWQKASKLAESIYAGKE
jgi:hypothetical protein